MRDVLARAFAALAMILALCCLMVVITSPRPSFGPSPAPTPTATPRARVALDCSRPQGRHRWVADMISPPTTADDGTKVTLTTRDAKGNSDNTEIDIKGWLCVIDAEEAR